MFSAKQIESLHLGLDARLRELMAIVQGMSQLQIDETIEVRRFLARLFDQTRTVAGFLDKIEINTRATAERVALLHDLIATPRRDDAPDFDEIYGMRRFERDGKPVARARDRCGIDGNSFCENEHEPIVEGPRCEDCPFRLERVQDNPGAFLAARAAAAEKQRTPPPPPCPICNMPHQPACEPPVGFVIRSPDGSIATKIGENRIKPEDYGHVRRDCSWGGEICTSPTAPVGTAKIVVSGPGWSDDMRCVWCPYKKPRPTATQALRDPNLFPAGRMGTFIAKAFDDGDLP